MKLNSYISAILLLLCSYQLFAQNQGIEFYLYNSKNIRLLESRLEYRLHPLPSTTMDINGQSSWEERLNFNQQAKRSLLGSSFSTETYRITHGLFVEYESYYDASDLDPSAYINKNAVAGYRLYVPIADSLNLSLSASGLIRNEQDRYREDNYLKSDGFHLQGSSRFGMQMGKLSSWLSATAEQKKLDWEAFDDLGLSLNLKTDGVNLIWDSALSGNLHQEDIYNLSVNEDDLQSTYRKLDTQKRETISARSNLYYYPSENIEISLSENYSMRNTKMQQNNLKNNDETVNEFIVNANYTVFSDLLVNLQSIHNLGKKDFSYAQNTRETETKNLSSTISWEYAPMDSLITNIGINLQTTAFPKNQNRWDNDLRNRYVRVAWKHFYHDLILLSNKLQYNLREDVYIDSLLSANNHQISSLSYIPEIDILLGDRLSFRQGYQIRADYTFYNYPDIHKDKLYRQLAYRYNIIFDTYPYAARSANERWMQLPYRQNKGQAFQVNLGFSYEENQYADKEPEYYLITNKNRRYQSSLNIKHDIGDFYYTIMPEYIWGTWKEYNLILGANYQFDNSSYLELSITPTSEDMKSIDWRSSLNLNLRF